MAHVANHLCQILGFHDFTALTKDDLTLIIHHIVEFQQLLTNVEVTAFGLGLRLFKRFVHPWVNDRLAFFHAQRRQHLFQPFRAEDAHQIVFEAKEECRTTGIALATGSTAQLVVDAAAFVAFGGQNEQATCGFDSLFILDVGLFDPCPDLIGVGIGVCGDGFHDLELDIAAQFDIGSATGHVGGDGHRAQLAGIGDDLRLLFVLAGVQDAVFDLGFGQHLGQEFGFFDGGRAHQNRLPGFVGFANFFDNRLVFFARGAIDRVMFVLSGHRHVGWNLNHAQPINFSKFIGFGGGSAGHSTEFVIESEVVLESHRGQRDVFGLDRATFFGFDRLVQTVGQAPPGHHPAGKLIDQDNFVIANDIILVLGEQLMRA